MKKRISMVLAAILMTVSVMGCSSSPGDQATQESGGTETAEAAGGTGSGFGGVENPEDQTYLWVSYESTDDFMLMVYEGFEDCGKIPSLTVNRRKNRRIPCIYWAAAIFSLLRTIVIYSFPLLFFWIVLILLLVMNW